MGELTIRTDRRFPTVRSQGTAKGERTAGGSPASGTAKAASTAQEALEQLTRTDSRAVRQAREALRGLQSGEGALAELEDSLGRLGDLARQAAEGGPADREALQAELERLQKEVERILDTGISLLPESGGEAGDRLAVLYLGAVIAGGGELPAQLSPEQALEGLKLLLEKVAGGMDPDQAVALLTKGRFISLAEFQTWFAGGSTAMTLPDGLLTPDLSAGLLDLNAMLPDLSALFPLLELGGSGRELMAQVLTALESLPAGPEAAAGDGQNTPNGSLPVMRAGEFQAAGRDLSGVSFQEASGQWTVGGRSDVTLQGTKQQGGAIVLTGSGTVTLRDVRAASLTAAAPEARIFTAGETAVGELRLEAGAVLTVDGTGPLKVDAFRTEAGALLRLAEGASVMPGKPGREPGEEPLVLTVPVVLEGPASLAAAPRAGVRGADGKALDPFDILWEKLLPGWTGITSVAVDGKQARMALLRGDPARLWLSKGEHGCDIHDLVLQGRDQAGRPQTRYAYLVWDQKRKAFEEMTLCDNPFSVTGGEPGLDWVYEGETRTLRILSDRVTAVSGGSGEGEPSFGGRIALADGIGTVRLTLEGVVCRTAAGSALYLGRDNDVTLLLRDGTDSRFESGPGCAGISLGEGASLRLDRAAPGESGRGGEGALTAAGGEGGAGIGRDGGGSRDRAGSILILGGSITASGGTSAAGIGAGQHSAVGAITIAGGTVVSTGGNGGGAGIGGALNAPAGDIQIRGGRITAGAAGHAAAIGSGIQGACGDILITGTARIIKADAIGACPLGGCGRVTVSGGADIGAARIATQADVPPEEGPPQLLLTLEGLGLDRVRVRTLEEAQRAVPGVDRALRRLAALRRVYGEMYARAERSGSLGIWPSAGEPVRDIGAAGELLDGLKRSAPQAVKAHGRPAEAGELLKG